MHKFNAGLLIGLALGTTAVALSEDWTKPSITSNYTDVLSELKARDESCATMDYTGATNLPTGVIRWNAGTKKFESFDGVSSWTDIHPEIAQHLASTSNPHSVTASQVGAASTSNLNAHTGNVSNPHSVTPGQIGAFKISNNLSEVAHAPTLRGNINAASASDLTSHTSNTSNPHNVTAAQTGALKASNNLSDVSSASAARGNIGAAESGVNIDITSLRASALTPYNNLTIDTTGAIGSYISFRPGSLTQADGRWRLMSTGKWETPANKQRFYSFFPYSTTRSIDPSASTDAKATACANMLNTLVQDFIDLGFLYEAP